MGKNELARILTDELAHRTDRRPDAVNCPSDLPRTTGATVRCTLVQAGQQVGIVTATFNDRGRIDYNFDVTLPTPPPASTPPASAEAPGPGR